MTGRVVRTLEQSPRLAFERFWIDAERGPLESPHGWNEDDVLDARPFAGSPIGPLLLWDEVVGTTDDLPMLLNDYFPGNLDVWNPPPIPVEFDVRGLTALSDEEFWPVIEEMGGRLWESKLKKASRSLSARDEDFILRWQETVAQHAVRLIKAFEAAGIADQLREAGGTHILGAILGAGRAAYEYSIANPTDYVDSSLADLSFLVLSLGGMALEKKLKQKVTVTSSFTDANQRLRRSADASMAAHAANAETRGGWGADVVHDRLGPDPDMHEVVDLISSGELSLEGHRAVQALWLPPQIRPAARALESVSLRGARALIEAEGDIRMRIILADAPKLEGDIRPRFRAPLESFGGAVCSTIEITDAGYAYPMNSDILTIKRRFTGNRADYIQRFVNPLPAD